MPCVRMILLAFLSPIASAKLCTASGSATFARILIPQAAGWPLCMHGATMRSGGGLRKTTPAASAASIVGWGASAIWPNLRKFGVLASYPKSSPARIKNVATVCIQTVLRTCAHLISLYHALP